MIFTFDWTSEKNQSVSQLSVDCCSACPVGMGAWIGVWTSEKNQSICQLSASGLLLSLSCGYGCLDWCVLVLDLCTGVAKTKVFVVDFLVKRMPMVTSSSGRN